MNVLGMMKQAGEKFSDFLLDPPEAEDVVIEDEEVVQNVEKTKAKTTVSSTQTVKVANGPDYVYTAPQFTSTKASEFSVHSNVSVPEPVTPSLKVVKQPKARVKIVKLTCFDDTRVAADALKAGKCVIINFEEMDYAEQSRICDFMNGACYVLDGSVKRITSTMVLYVPSGTSIGAVKK